jgi:hypothetical protein
MRRVSLPRLWAFLALALPTLAAMVVNLPTVDLAYHLRAGAQILDAHALPATDAWTFTALGQPWVDQQWGAQVILQAIYAIGGWSGLVVMKAVLVLVIFGCLFEIGRRRGLEARGAALLTLAAFGVAAPTLSLRPQLIAMALFAVVLLLVADRRAHPRRLWAVPVIVMVWASVHGSFFLGPGVLGLAWLEDLHDRADHPTRTLQIAVVSGLAACISPIGPAVWLYAIGLSTNSQITNQVAEWRPTSLRDPSGLAFFVSALAIAAWLARRGREVAWPALLWLLVFFVIGAYAVRGLAWWPLAMVPIVAGLASRSTGDTSRRSIQEQPWMRRVNLGIAGVMVAVGVILVPWWRPIDPGTEAPRDALGFAPPGITAALRNLGRPTDRLFNPQTWGSWFEFALPRMPVAVDSRIELFPTAVWDGYQNVLAGVDGWQDQLDRWDVTIVVVREDDVGLAARLVAAGWRSAFSDVDGSVFLAPGRS